ncbi:5-methyltetrahydropteroyltriglutamate--homocysteine methyltransferase 2-like [Diospyros lotus]|uniref:5-methyltetrahydropteroyltriglutamate-- homocysteine methyltransferase 2-like n=1 Tax=Diospyros lotus TaxID=55363 RepID=UPI00224EF163|nr:5-methyltetrahydropteroyltriglutamate--homocysteine methyltransferase 2-like [Diospyros lotus]
MSIDMDADVITIENSRSHEKLLSVLHEGVKFGAGIGPGAFDIQRPGIPSTKKIAINKMLQVLGPNELWVNPGCGLETRKHTEVKLALQNMVVAAKQIRTPLVDAGDNSKWRRFIREGKWADFGREGKWAARPTSRLAQPFGGSGRIWFARETGRKNENWDQHDPVALNKWAKAGWAGLT